MNPFKSQCTVQKRASVVEALYPITVHRTTSTPLALIKCYLKNLFHPLNQIKIVVVFYIFLLLALLDRLYNKAIHNNCFSLICSSTIQRDNFSSHQELSSSFDLRTKHYSTTTITILLLLYYYYNSPFLLQGFSIIFLNNNFYLKLKQNIPKKCTATYYHHKICSHQQILAKNKEQV